MRSSLLWVEEPGMSLRSIWLAEANEVRIVAVPGLSVDDEQDLQKRLVSVSAPKVGGSVKLDYILNVWGVLRP